MTRAALLVLVLSACAHRPEAPPEDPDRDKLPLIDLPAVGPEDYSPSMLQGRVVLVHFMATWCLPCLSELPNLRAMQQKFGARGFQIIAIGMDLEGKKVLEPFAYHYRLPFPVLLANGDYQNGRSRFGLVNQLPTNFLFARDGKVKAAWVGLVPQLDVDSAVDDLLNE